MKKILLLIFLACSMFSCNNSQIPAEEPEQPISIEMLKNRKILSITNIGHGTYTYSSTVDGVLFDTTIVTSRYDTTRYTYDSQKRLSSYRTSYNSYEPNPQKDFAIELSEIMIDEYVYQYEGLKETENFSRTTYKCVNGEMRLDNTGTIAYTNRIRIYTDTTFTKVKTETRERNNYSCVREYDNSGRVISYDESYEGMDYLNNSCRFHNTATYTYNGVNCTWIVETYKDDVLYEIYEGQETYAEEQCEHILMSNREYTKYPPIEEYYRENTYYSRHIKTEQTNTYDAYFRLLTKTQNRYTVQGNKDVNMDEYTYTGKTAIHKYFVNGNLSNEEKITYIDL